MRRLAPQREVAAPSAGTLVPRLWWLAVVAIAALAAWQLADVLILLFGACLFAILLSQGAEVIERGTGLPRGIALAIELLALLVILTLAVWLAAPSLTEQLAALAAKLPQLADRVRAQIEAVPFGHIILANLPKLEDVLPNAEGVFGRLTGAASITLTVLTNLLLIVAIGAYLAGQPRLYGRGLALLLPPDREQRVAEVMRQTGSALRRWLHGQLVAMILVGAATALGLLALGVPFALALGLIAGLMEFIPFVGPLLATLPALLVALAESPATALKVLALYVIVQQIEGYLITPLVQRQAAHLPPAIAIVATVAFGVLIGPLGVVFATPLAVALMVWIRCFYVEDVLGRTLKKL